MLSQPHICLVGAKSSASLRGSIASNQPHPFSLTGHCGHAISRVMNGISRLTTRQFAQELLSTFGTALGEVALQFIVEIFYAPPDSPTSSDFESRPVEAQRHVLWDRKVEGGFPGMSKSLVCYAYTFSSSFIYSSSAQLSSSGLSSREMGGVVEGSSESHARSFASSDGRCLKHALRVVGHLSTMFVFLCMSCI